MKIAVVTPLFPIAREPYRGQPIYRTVRAMAERAEVRAFYVAARYPPLLRPRSFEYKPADAGWQPEGVATTYLSYPSLPWLGRRTNPAASLRAMIGPLREFGPDVIVAYWLYPEGLGALRAARELGVPVVVGSRGSDLLRIPDEVSLAGTREVVRSAAATLVVSEEMRRKAVALGADGGRVHVVVNGCDRSVFRPRERGAARSRLGIEAGARLILFVGHLIPGKGVPELVEASRELRAGDGAVRLALIGEGALAEGLRREEGLLLPGPKSAEEVAEWLAAADLLALPSHSEGCPNVVIEALACGRPVVGTRVGAIPDLVDETCGVLVGVKDAAALREGLRAALDGAWDAEGIAGRHGRSWGDVAEETLGVCADVLRAPAKT